MDSESRPPPTTSPPAGAVASIQSVAPHQLASTGAGESGKQESNAAVTPKPKFSEFEGLQYEQLHELKRMYNNMIFQAPTILVALLGAAVVFLPNLDNKDSLGNIQKLLPALGLVLGVFSFVLSYWAYRTRVLLRRIEDSLAEFDAAFGSLPLRIYPFQLRASPKRKPSPGLLRRLWYAACGSIGHIRHSTVQIIVFMFFVSFLLVGVSAWFLLHSGSTP